MLFLKPSSQMKIYPDQATFSKAPFTTNQEKHRSLPSAVPHWEGSAGDCSGLGKLRKGYGAQTGGAVKQAWAVGFQRSGGESRFRPHQQGEGPWASDSLSINHALLVK